MGHLTLAYTNGYTRVPSVLLLFTDIVILKTGCFVSILSGTSSTGINASGSWLSSCRYPKMIFSLIQPTSSVSRNKKTLFFTAVQPTSSLGHSSTWVKSQKWFNSLNVAPFSTLKYFRTHIPNILAENKGKVNFSSVGTLTPLVPVYSSIIYLCLTKLKCYNLSYIVLFSRPDN